jgi:hypothetical protein
MIRHIDSTSKTFGLILNDPVRARMTFLGPRLTYSSNILGKVAVKWLQRQAVAPWQECTVDQIVPALALIEKVNAEIQRWKLDGYIRLGFDVEIVPNPDPLNVFSSL